MTATVFATRLGRWGGGPGAPARLAVPRDAAEAAGVLALGAVTPRGAGRAYSDAAAPGAAGVAVATARLDRLLAFDEVSGGGAVEAEAGVRLDDLTVAALRRGWFPPVLPGTGAVTLGGAVAADVHGKNHHAADGWGGSFADHLDWIDVLDRGVRRLGPGEAGFAAAAGGMGLTGLILGARLRLRPVETGWLRVETRAARDLGGVMAGLADAGDGGAGGAPYAVAWLDGFDARGRGLVQTAAHAGAGELGARERADRLAERGARGAREVPAAAGALPGGLMAGRATALALRLAGAAVWRRGGAQGLRSWRAVFHPLDGLGRWDRLYGRAGLVQVQAVWPEAGAEAALAGALAEARAAGGAFLAVLKRLGPGAEARGRGGAGSVGGVAGGFSGGFSGGLSFPMAGWTLALDFPAAPWGRRLAARLTARAAASGGRVYLAKDMALGREGLSHDPRAAAFRALREATGAAGRFESALSARLGL